MGQLNKIFNNRANRFEICFGADSNSLLVILKTGGLNAGFEILWETEVKRQEKQAVNWLLLEKLQIKAVLRLDENQTFD
jgi:hypothetical protein